MSNAGFGVRGTACRQGQETRRTRGASHRIPGPSHRATDAIGWFGPELSVNKPVSGCNGADYYLLYVWGLAR